MSHSVILHTMDNGALLSVVESTGYARSHNARQHAAKCAQEYAARYPNATVREHAGQRFTIADSRGYTFAQFDIV